MVFRLMAGPRRRPASTRVLMMPAVRRRRQRARAPVAQPPRSLPDALPVARGSSMPATRGTATDTVAAVAADVRAGVARDRRPGRRRHAPGRGAKGAATSRCARCRPAPTTSSRRCARRPSRAGRRPRRDRARPARTASAPRRARCGAVAARREDVRAGRRRGEPRRASSARARSGGPTDSASCSSRSPTPGAVGLSAIAGLLAAAPRGGGRGLHVVRAPRRGRARRAGPARARAGRAGRRRRVPGDRAGRAGSRSGPRSGTLALDGEREFERPRATPFPVDSSGPAAARGRRRGHAPRRATGVLARLQPSRGVAPAAQHTEESPCQQSAPPDLGISPRSSCSRPTG